MKCSYQRTNTQLPSKIEKQDGVKAIISYIDSKQA